MIIIINSKGDGSATVGIGFSIGAGRKRLV
jgi:hypothetical protein